jgi:hypothetical protein
MRKANTASPKQQGTPQATSRNVALEIDPVKGKTGNDASICLTKIASLRTQWLAGFNRSQ